MPSAKTRSQDFAVKVLGNHLREGRVAHTYLLTGSASSGKDELAMDFACALNCVEENGFKDCSCASCAKIRKELHPDVHWAGRDPLVRSIKIEEVRDVLRAACLRPYEGKRKVFILQGAGRLTLEAANALLKTLEEPPGLTVFVLLAQARSELLETIQSRSFEVRLKPVDERELESEESDRIRGVLAMASDWDDFLKAYQEKPREELKGVLAGLAGCLSDTLRRRSDAGAGTVRRLPAWLEAVDRVMETREAVEDNANQKLALTRLAIRLGNLLALEEIRS
ncbi:MAG: hypothetical protein WC352_06700 [Candidatus Omnitrophota bacterium]|jgi:hypothetical protein